MQKPSNTVRVEHWTLRAGTKQEVTVRKVAVRVKKGLPGAGTFHSATNFQGSVLGKV